VRTNQHRFLLSTFHIVVTQQQAENPSHLFCGDFSGTDSVMSRDTSGIGTGLQKNIGSWSVLQVFVFTVPTFRSRFLPYYLLILGIESGLCNQCSRDSKSVVWVTFSE
jgi:hypothetical protein